MIRMICDVRQEMGSAMIDSGLDIETPVPCGSWLDSEVAVMAAAYASMLFRRDGESV
jgi:hypothetical protein